MTCIVVVELYRVRDVYLTLRIPLTNQITWYQKWHQRVREIVQTGNSKEIFVLETTLKNLKKGFQYLFF